MISQSDSGVVTLDKVVTSSCDSLDTLAYLQKQVIIVESEPVAVCDAFAMPFLCQHQ